MEFVRQRFWVDSDVGTVFWHDHALGRVTWPHGGFGTIVIEPVGSTYHDPKTGKQVRSGPLVDIRTAEPVGFGVNGSFRELVVQLNDTVPHTVNIVTEGNPPGQPIEVALEAGRRCRSPCRKKIPMSPMAFPEGTHTTGGGLNFKVEPISSRLAFNPDTSKLFSSEVHGDPYTPMVRAYLGDTVVFVCYRRWPTRRWSGRCQAIPISPSDMPAMPIGKIPSTSALPSGTTSSCPRPRTRGCAGDYIHLNGRVSKFSEVRWHHACWTRRCRTFRSCRQAIAVEMKFRNRLGCPADAPVKAFNVVAMDYPG